MVFSSITFLLLFLPLVLAAYHLLFLPVTLGRGAGFWRRASNVLLLLASLVFYFWGEGFLVWILLASTGIDYVCGLVIASGFPKGAELPGPDGGRTACQKATLIASICSNLAFLGFFKYFNFGVDSFNGLAAAAGLEGWRWDGVARIALPLGISFYTFQSMSYTIDVYLGHTRATRNLVDFACYVTLFPQLVAGPIVRYRDVAAELVGRTVSCGGFASGVVRFTLGLGKKLLIANTAAVAADHAFALPAGELSTPMAWFGVAAYTLQIYFDFSGYSDMAIGLGRMLGFTFCENFNYPYVATSLGEFWRRWHISLSTWFRDYVYIPLGGNRRSRGRTYFNLVAVFFLCGLWHGASWTFVIWGLFHGAFLILERLEVFRRTIGRLGPLRHAYCLGVVMVGWVVFRTDSAAGAAAMLAAMAGFGAEGSWGQVLDAFSTDVPLLMAVGAVLAAPVLPTVRRWAARHLAAARPAARWRLALSWQAARVGATAALLLLCIMWLAAGTHNPFIYFRF
ncbi:MAG: MBOAT family protein [Planctomycetes bacterium]|nr:MBOAT family protein [Planctomycetota bacterium]